MSDLPEETKREEPDEIIEDLKSIKSLLDEESLDADQANTQAHAPTLKVSDDDVPLLDDPLEQEVGTINAGMSDDTFTTLLGDTWQDSVEEIFDEARERIQSHSTSWLPEHTDELADALKIRIDVSVRAWLAETLEANIDSLRERIVAELSAELMTQMREKFSQPPTLEDEDQNHG